VTRQTGRYYGYGYGYTYEPYRSAKHATQAAHPNGSSKAQEHSPR
jgi:hypothetical protein